MLVASSKKFFSTMVVALLLVSSTAFALVLVPKANASTTPVGIVIPLYSYPTSGTWSAVIQAKESHPNVPVIAIVSPGSGPGSSQDPNFVQGIKSLQASGVKVLGYVDTAYAADSISSVESQVNLWKAWYAPNGIFFDEMNNVLGFESYYSTLGAYVHSLGMSTTMGNPGTSVPTSYVGTLDILNVFESDFYPALSFITYPGYSPSNFATMSYGVGLDSSFLTGASGIVSWVYLTDATTPNPYGTLPSYFASEFSALSSLDGPGSGSSTTTTTSTTGTTDTVSVNSVDLSGAAIEGLWSTWSRAGVPLSTGYTPATYGGAPGLAYTLTVSNYANYVFCHWQDGNTSSARQVMLQGDEALTAYYSTTGTCPVQPVTVPVTVKTDSGAGASITGLYIVVTLHGNTNATGFSTFEFNATAGQTYGVTAENYGAYAFSHWADGTTNPTITIVPGQATTLIAYYNVELRTG